MTSPRVETCLPDLMPFLETLAHEYTSQQVQNWDTFRVRVETFFTPARLAEFDAVVSGWQTMADYNNQVTLVHVSAVLVSLLLSPEYQAMTPADQNLMGWIVLFHDVAKVALKGTRDTIHGFRSTVLTARALPQLGFALNDGAGLESWCDLTWNAITTATPPTQDNAQLPTILAGIQHHFGAKTPAALILEAVLFHMSIDVVLDYPQTAPLTADEIATYIYPALMPLLKCMMLVDSDAWSLFDPAIKERQRAETLAVFEVLQERRKEH